MSIYSMGHGKSYAQIVFNTKYIRGLVIDKSEGGIAFRTQKDADEFIRRERFRDFFWVRIDASWEKHTIPSRAYHVAGLDVHELITNLPIIEYSPKIVGLVDILEKTIIEKYESGERIDKTIRKTNLNEHAVMVFLKQYFNKR